jgi:hypothetical protein
MTARGKAVNLHFCLRIIAVVHDVPEPMFQDMMLFSPHCYG